MTADELMTTGPVSPLAGYVERFAALETATDGQIRLAEVPFLAQVSLRVPTDPRAAADSPGSNAVLGCALPPPGHTAVGRAAEDWPLVLGLGPDEWLLLSAPGTQADLEDGLRAAGCDAVTDVSGQRTLIALTGTRARDVLAKGCALDLHPSVFRTGRCAQTLLARAQIVLLPAPGAGASLWILPRSSYARYVADWLLDAAEEYTAGSAG